MSATEATIVPFPVKTKLVCSECGAAGEGSCRCGAPYVTPGVRAEAAVQANPEKSDRAIAEKIGVSDKTVRRARKRTTADKSAVQKRTGRDGKTRAMPRQRKQGPMPKTDAVREAIRPLVEKGIPINRNELEEKLGASHGIIASAEQRELGRLEGIQEKQEDAIIDRIVLSMSAQQKVDAVLNRERARDAAALAKRMAEVQAEVDRRVIADNAPYVAHLKKRDLELFKKEEWYRELINDHRPPLTEAEWGLLQLCVGANPSDENRSKAMLILNGRRSILTGKKEVR